jgi:hypothetical protein
MTQRTEYIPTTRSLPLQSTEYLYPTMIDDYNVSQKNNNILIGSIVALIIVGSFAGIYYYKKR